MPLVFIMGGGLTPWLREFWAAETGAVGESGTDPRQTDPAPWTRLSKSMTVTHGRVCGYDTNTGLWRLCPVETSPVGGPLRNAL